MLNHLHNDPLQGILLRGNMLFYPCQDFGRWLSAFEEGPLTLYIVALSGIVCALPYVVYSMVPTDCVGMLLWTDVTCPANTVPQRIVCGKR